MSSNFLFFALESNAFFRIVDKPYHRVALPRVRWKVKEQVHRRQRDAPTSSSKCRWRTNLDECLQVSGCEQPRVYISNPFQSQAAVRVFR